MWNVWFVGPAVVPSESPPRRGSTSLVAEKVLFRAFLSDPEAAFDIRFASQLPVNSIQRAGGGSKLSHCNVACALSCVSVCLFLLH